MITLYLLPVLLFILYGYWTRNHDYWAKRNVKHDRPLPFFGNHLLNFLLRRSRPDIGLELYNKYKSEKIVGYYKGNKLELIVRDPEIMKQIFNRDFEYFSGRCHIDLKKNRLLHNIAFMNGDEWRATKAKFASALMPSKLKAMFPLLQECLKELQQSLHKAAHDEISTFDLMTDFTLNCMGSACFGVDLKMLNTENFEFLRLSRLFLKQTRLQVFQDVLHELIPTNLFNSKLVNQDLENAVYNITKKMLADKDFKPNGRNDFLDALLKTEHRSQNATGHCSINIDYMAAKLFTILSEGCETTALSISYTLHQLAHNPRAQEKVHREINLVMASYYGTLTFESIHQMPYLEMAWKESMRLFSPQAEVSRVCQIRYKIPGTDVTIDPGVTVTFPCQALNLDPDYFQLPYEFYPERFTREAEVQVGKTCSVFGDGHRKCLGMRLATVISLSALAVVLHQFSVVPAPSSKRHPTTKITSHQVQNFENGLPLLFIPRIATNNC